MKKRGFTLIELLAVIVILAIIALIATPIVMNVIENSKKGAAERSAENYVDAVELAVATKRLDGPVEDGEYEIQEDGNLCIVENGTVNCSKSRIDVEINGDKPAFGGTILIENGQVVDELTEGSTNKTTMTIGDYTVSYDTSGKIVAEKEEPAKNFGTVLDLFETEATEIIEFIKNQKTGEPTLTYNPITGEKGCVQDNTSCFGWYVLEDKGIEDENVTLIMDRNLGDPVAWCGDETLCKVDGEWDVSNGPITANNYLEEQTSDWTVEAYLPSYGLIGGAKESTLYLPKWLFDYLDGTTNSVPGVTGYWTTTRLTSRQMRVVANKGLTSNATYIYSEGYGVRPVITIPKTKLN